MILIVEEQIIFEFEVRLSTQRLMLNPYGINIWTWSEDQFEFVIISEWLSWGESLKVLIKKNKIDKVSGCNKVSNINLTASMKDDFKSWKFMHHGWRRLSSKGILEKSWWFVGDLMIL